MTQVTAALRSGWPAASMLIGILLIGLVLRTIGLNWGLPTQLNTDEWVIVRGAIDLAERNSFEPSFYFRPDHLEIQLSFLAYTAFARVILGQGVVEAYAADPSVFLLISRLITASIGTVTVVLAYLIGRRVAVSVGIVAAALFALFPPFVHHAHFATPDVPITATMMGVVLACMHYLSKPSVASLLVATALTAAGIAIKYPGALTTLIIAVVIVVAALRERAYLRIVKHGLIALVSTVGFLFLISPVLFTNARAVVAAFATEVNHDHPGAEGTGFLGNAAFYVVTFAGFAGVLIVAFSVIGVVFAVGKKHEETIAWSLGAIVWIALSALFLHWERWALPMYITPLLFAALGMVSTWEWARQRWGGRRWVRAVGIAAAVVMGLNLVIPSLAQSVRFTTADTRVSARDDVAALGSSRSNTLFEGYTTFMPTLALVGPDGSSTVFANNMPVWQTPVLFGEVDITDGRVTVTDESTEFIQISSCIYDRYLEDPRYEVEQAFYQQLDDNLEIALRVTAQNPEAGIPLEAFNIGQSIILLTAYAAGTDSGCDLTVYRVPD